MAKEKIKRVIFVGDKDLADSYLDWKNGFELSIDSMESLASNIRIARILEEDNSDDDLAFKNLLGLIKPKYILTEEDYLKLMKQADAEGALCDDFSVLYHKPQSK